MITTSTVFSSCCIVLLSVGSVIISFIILNTFTTTTPIAFTIFSMYGAKAIITFSSDLIATSTNFNTARIVLLKTGSVIISFIILKIDVTIGPIALITVASPSKNNFIPGPANAIIFPKPTRTS